MPRSNKSASVLEEFLSMLVVGVLALITLVVATGAIILMIIDKGVPSLLIIIGTVAVSAIASFARRMNLKIPLDEDITKADIQIIGNDSPIIDKKREDSPN